MEAQGDRVLVRWGADPTSNGPLDPEVEPDCVEIGRREGVIDKSCEELGLADSRIAHHQQLEGGRARRVRRRRRNSEGSPWKGPKLMMNRLFVPLPPGAKLFEQRALGKWAVSHVQLSPDKFSPRELCHTRACEGGTTKLGRGEHKEYLLDQLRRQVTKCEHGSGEGALCRSVRHRLRGTHAQTLRQELLSKLFWDVSGRQLSSENLVA